MSDTKHIANMEGGWRAVCTAPDFCKVGNAIVGFDSFATLDCQQQVSPNVKARSTPVYRQGDLFKVVQADAGQHIVSGTSQGSGFVKILDGHANVKVNGVPVARHNSACLINCDASGNGGAMGKLVTVQKGTAPAPPASNPQAPPGERTSPRLEQLKAEKARLEASQLDFNALDEYVNFKQSNQVLDDAIGGIRGQPGTARDYAAQAARGVLGFGKDVGMGIAELAYEGIKAVPKLVRADLTETGQRIGQLNGAIFAENMRLGNITAGTIGADARKLGQAVVKPITDPWAKGQYVEAAARGVAEVATLGVGFLKAGKLGGAAKAGQAAKTGELVKAAEAGEVAGAGKAANAAKAGDGVHVTAPRPLSISELLEHKWGKAKVEEALAAKRADPKLNALLTDEEYLAIRAYTSNLYREINPALRRGAAGEWEGLVKEASRGMEKLAENGYGFKGVVRRDAFFSKGEIDRLFKRDGVFADPGFLSSSTKLEGVFPGNTVIELNSKNGVLINSLSEFADEAEVLFKPGTRFRVLEVIEDATEGKMKIHLSEF